MEKEFEKQESMNVIHTLTNLLQATANGQAVLNEDEASKVKSKLMEYVNYL